MKCKAMHLNKEARNLDIHIRLAEYQTLRSESDRISQFLATAIWVGLTGFALSIAAAGTLSSAGIARPKVVQVTTVLLVFQSLAISTMYLSELYKYKRVGGYIRTHIESRFGARLAKSERPLNWETWIEPQRSTALHISSFVFLQSPVIGAFLLFVGEWMGLIGNSALFGRFAKYLHQDLLSIILVKAIILFDVVFLGLLINRIRKWRPA